MAKMAADPTIAAIMAVGPLDSKLTAAALAATARARGEAKFLPLDVSAGSVNLTAYAALDPDGGLHLVAINKDLTQNATLTITPGAGYQWALAMRLNGTAVDSVTGTTLGGAPAPTRSAAAAAMVP